MLGALLIARHPRAVVETFLTEAEYDTTRMAQLGDEWAPIADSTIFHHAGLVLGPLESALRNKVAAAGGDGTIESVAAALASPGESHPLSATRPESSAVLTLVASWLAGVLCAVLITPSLP